MKKLLIPKVRWYKRLADVLMLPIMVVLRGFRLDSLQGTHAWNVYKGFDATDIDPALCVVRTGTDKTIFAGRYSFLFHAPVFGGWRNFSVYEVKKGDAPFFIGWIVRGTGKDEVIDVGVQELPLRDDQVRMLDGPPAYTTSFFALNQAGEQIALRAVGHGRIGDGTYLDTRLF